MSNIYTVAILVGSLRKESISRKVALAVAELAPANLTFQIVEIGDLPLYSEDIDGDSPPDAYSYFRKQVSACDAVLFVTPEYNRSVPAALKNAIDIGSRPNGKNLWSGKPGAVISVSSGSGGRFGANHHLRQSLVFLDVPCMQQPEVYLGRAASMFDDEDKLSKSKKTFLKKFIDAYAQWVEQLKNVKVDKVRQKRLKHTSEPQPAKLSKEEITQKMEQMLKQINEHLAVKK